jgi:hypothetical protein
MQTDNNVTYSDKYRMYGLVNYQLSGIQQGIQYGHALQEYNNIMMSNHKLKNDKSQTEFDIWRYSCKTFIILNGGTTNNYIETYGTMNLHQNTLHDMNWLYAAFNEPDLGNQLTAIVFLVPEQVYNRKLYPDFWEWEIAKNNFEKRDLDKIKSGDWDWEDSFTSDVTSREIMLLYMKWTDEVMLGSKNVNMRKWVSQFRLA